MRTLIYLFYSYKRILPCFCKALLKKEYGDFYHGERFFLLPKDYNDDDVDYYCEQHTSHCCHDYDCCGCVYGDMYFVGRLFGISIIKYSWSQNC